MKKYASLNINFDSILECVKLSSGSDAAHYFDDPSYFAGIDRFFELCDKFNVKLSIFVIGRDLEKNHNIFAQVRKWAESGHEIGNHSYSHPSNLSELSQDEVYAEVKKSHEIISECTGIAPRGFIAPAWSYSPYLPEILQKFGYLYDTSLAPSYMMPVSQIKLKMQSKAPVPVIRRDFRGSMTGARQPFFCEPDRLFNNSSTKGTLLQMPLPTTWFRFPVWHTIGFLMGSRKKLYKYFLENAMNTTDAFYYLMHPADMMTLECCPEEYHESLASIERINIPYDEKRDFMEWCWKIIVDKCEIVTMSELAEHYIDKKGLHYEGT